MSDEIRSKKKKFARKTEAYQFNKLKHFLFICTECIELDNIP